MGTSQGQPIRRLLIVKLSSLGDIAHALPIVAAIRRQMPHLFIGWVVRRRCADLLRGNPDIDRLYVIDDRPSVAALWKLRGELHGDKYDAAFDMQGLFLSGIVTALSGAHQRVGLSCNREANRMFLNASIKSGKDSGMHVFDVLSGFQKVLGIPEGPSLAPQKFLVDSESAFATELLRGSKKPVIALNVGAATPQKRWPITYWIAVGKWVVDNGGTVVLLGGPTDTLAAGEVSDGISGGGQVRNLAGKTSLRQLASVIARCDSIVSGDSGSLHIAIVVGVPTVSIYGPTSARWTGPRGDRHVVLTRNMPCSPCHRKPTCNGRFDCMKNILPTEVIDGLSTLIAKPPPAVAGAPTVRQG